MYMRYTRNVGDIILVRATPSQRCVFLTHCDDVNKLSSADMILTLVMNRIPSEPGRSITEMGGDSVMRLELQSASHLNQSIGAAVCRNVLLMMTGW